jgi:peroxiredoxin 6
MHKEWIKDIKSYARLESDDFPFQIIADSSREISKLLGMIDPAEVDAVGMPLSARAVFFIDPSKKMRASILYPATTGRNFK